MQARGVARAKEAHVRGDIKKFTRELTYIANKGTLKEKQVMWAYMQDVVHSEFLKCTSGKKGRYSTGMRWRQSSKLFLASQKVMNDKRSSNGIRHNIGGPHLQTVQKEIRKHCVSVKSGLDSLPNFQAVKKWWSKSISKRKISHPEESDDPILCEMSEDESDMIPALFYDADKDGVGGSCGWKHPNHKCDPSFCPVIDNDWDNLVKIVKEVVASTYVRVIMLNPLVSWLRHVYVRLYLQS